VPNTEQILPQNNSPIESLPFVQEAKRRTNTPSQVRISRHKAKAQKWLDAHPEHPDAHVGDYGGIVFKQTVLPTPDKLPSLPKPTAATSRHIRRLVMLPEFMKYVDRVPRVRNKASYRNTLIKLIEIAGYLSKWQFVASQDWLGERCGLSQQAFGKQVEKLDAAGLLARTHNVSLKQDDDAVKRGRRPPKAINLRPLVRLIISDPSLKLLKKQKGPYSQPKKRPVLTDVYVKYIGLKGDDDTDMLGDVTMRALYVNAVERRREDTVLVRPLNASSIAVIDYLQDVRTADRNDIVSGTGLTKGAVAGASRILEQLGVVSVEWEGHGRPKIYTLLDDWEQRLERLLPDMTTYGALARLHDRNLYQRIRALEWEIDLIERKAKRENRELTEDEEIVIEQFNASITKLKNRKQLFRLDAIRTRRIGRPALEMWEREHWAA